MLTETSFKILSLDTYSHISFQWPKTKSGFTTGIRKILIWRLCQTFPHHSWPSIFPMFMVIQLCRISPSYSKINLLVTHIILFPNLISYKRSEKGCFSLNMNLYLKANWWSLVFMKNLTALQLSFSTLASLRRLDFNIHNSPTRSWSPCILSLPRLRNTALLQLKYSNQHNFTTITI